MGSDICFDLTRSEALRPALLFDRDLFVHRRSPSATNELYGGETVVDDQRMYTLYTTTEPDRLQ